MKEYVVLWILVVVFTVSGIYIFNLNPGVKTSDNEKLQESSIEYLEHLRSSSNGQ